MSLVTALQIAMANVVPLEVAVLGIPVRQ